MTEIDLMIAGIVSMLVAIWWLYRRDWLGRLPRTVVAAPTNLARKLRIHEPLSSRSGVPKGAWTTTNENSTFRLAAADLDTAHPGNSEQEHNDALRRRRSGRKYVVVSPVRDEAAYLQRTIDSVVAQTVRPAVWVIVDDGSSDGTAAIADRAAAEHDWIRVHRREGRGRRRVGGGVVEAFEEGLRLLDLSEFDYICKLDGDLEFGATYFERLFERFEGNARLGTASGKAWIRVGKHLVPERSGDEFSQGQTKLYRVECYREIGGFVGHVMWDGIDCHRCRMLGWEARSFRDDELRFIHLRPMGSSFKHILHGRLRWGRGQYFMGTHWLYALGISVYRLFERPFIVGGLCILVGYISGYVRGLERYDDLDFRRHLHQWQMARLRSLR